MPKVALNADLKPICYPNTKRPMLVGGGVWDGLDRCQMLSWAAGPSPVRGSAGAPGQIVQILGGCVALGCPWRCVLRSERAGWWRALNTLVT